MNITYKPTELPSIEPGPKRVAVIDAAALRYVLNAAWPSVLPPTAEDAIDAEPNGHLIDAWRSWLTYDPDGALDELSAAYSTWLHEPFVLAFMDEIANGIGLPPRCPCC